MSLVFAEYAPLVLMSIMTVMMIEAGGSVDVNTMIPLPGSIIFLIHIIWGSYKTKHLTVCQIASKCSQTFKSFTKVCIVNNRPLCLMLVECCEY